MCYAFRCGFESFFARFYSPWSVRIFYILVWCIVAIFMHRHFALESQPNQNHCEAMSNEKIEPKKKKERNNQRENALRNKYTRWARRWKRYRTRASRRDAQMLDHIVLILFLWLRITSVNNKNFKKNSHETTPAAMYSDQHLCVWAYISFIQFCWVIKKKEVKPTCDAEKKIKYTSAQTDLHRPTLEHTNAPL